ncbi:cytochrome P450 [Marasmius fiardii PR-910]|nr:cytochrome P450 [Marasmius fiardii PR-910]
MLHSTMSSTYTRITLSATGLALANHLVFNHQEPNKKTFYRTVALLISEPLLLYAFNYPFLSCPGHLRLIVWSYITFFSVLSASIVLYRLSPFHPLADVPGPALAKVSKLYGIWIWLKGERHIRYKEMHEEYGPIVRIAPNEISVIDQDSMKAVLGPGGCIKGQAYSTRRDDRTEGSLLALTGEARIRRRRVWARGMSCEAIREYEPVVRQQASKLFERLYERTYKVVELGEWFNYFSFDFIVEVAFGSGSYMLNEGDKTELWEAMDKFAYGIEFLSHVPWLLNFFRDLPIPKPALRIRDLGLALATKRMQDGAKRKDLWYHLTDEAGLEKVKPSAGTVASDGVLAVMAGADTTSAALRNFFYLIVAHPEHYKRLQREIDSFYPPEADAMDSSKHNNLVYLNACINESLRLFPPLPTGGLREVPKGGRAIGGYFIPEGTQIHVPHYAIHRNSESFHCPDEFIPSRWLETDSSETTNSSAFLPFSFGPENCIGKNLARRVMMMLICLLMQNLEFRFADDFDWEEWPRKMKDYFVCSREPLNVFITPRM